MKRLMLLAAIALAVLVVPSAQGSPGMHKCGDYPSHSVYKVRADFACRKAVKVAKHWRYTGDAVNYVKGFRCTSKSRYDGSDVRCATKNRKVKFYMGG